MTSASPETLPWARIEGLSRAFWTLLLLGAGASHFLLEDFLVAQMPPLFDDPAWWVRVSGGVEIGLAVLLQIRGARAWAWMGVGLLCVAYLPVHWHIWVNCEALAAVNGRYHIPCWVALVRLPVQLGFVAWTLTLAYAIQLGWIRRHAGG